MRPAVTKYYVFKAGGLWWVKTYHPLKETRPPETRRAFAGSQSLAKLMNRLAHRIEEDKARQHRINQAH
jgi:hypothetical protein